MFATTPVRIFKYEVIFTSAKGREVKLQVDSMEDIEDLSLYHDMRGRAVHIKRGSFQHFDHPQPWT